MLDMEMFVATRPFAPPRQEIFALHCWALALAQQIHVS
jgi:hypothetical protein